MARPKFIVVDARESLTDSIARDAVTFALLLICIRASLGSLWWTIFTSTLFIVFLGGKILTSTRNSHHRFHSIHELKQWVDQESHKAQQRLGNP